MKSITLMVRRDLRSSRKENRFGFSRRIVVTLVETMTPFHQQREPISSTTLSNSTTNERTNPNHSQNHSVERVQLTSPCFLPSSIEVSDLRPSQEHYLASRRLHVSCLRKLLLPLNESSLWARQEEISMMPLSIGQSSPMWRSRPSQRPRFQASKAASFLPTCATTTRTVLAIQMESRSTLKNHLRR